MSFQESEITQIVSTIWGSILEMECEQTDKLPPVSEWGSSGTLSACVQITGEWQGAVVLGCQEAFASRAATIMFHTPADDKNFVDMQDAVAELTNMIGGNLKGLLTGSHTCQLSLPAVVAGADYTARIPGTRPLHRIAMRCGEHLIVINVMEKLPAALAA